MRAEVAAAAKGRGANTEAHRLYLQGRYLVDRLNQEDVQQGIQYLRQALDLDPGHALAWVQLSHAFYFQAGFDWAPVVEGYTRAREAAGRAVALEPDLAEAYAALGQVQIAFDWDWKGAEASYRRALELAPGSAEVLRGASTPPLQFGRHAEAVDLARRAVEQDPLSATGYVMLGRTYRATGALDKAHEAFRKALELAPQRIMTHFWLAITHQALGRDEEALAEAKLERAPWARACALGIVCHAAGRKAEADAALRELVEMGADTAAYQIAAVYAARAQRDEMFEWLERSYAQRDPGLAQMICEPVFRPHHGDPRWRAFARKMKFEG